MERPPATPLQGPVERGAGKGRSHTLSPSAAPSPCAEASAAWGSVPAGESGTGNVARTAARRQCVCPLSGVGTAQKRSTCLDNAGLNPPSPLLQTRGRWQQQCTQQTHCCAANHTPCQSGGAGVSGPGEGRAGGGRLGCCSGCKCGACANALASGVRGPGQGFVGCRENINVLRSSNFCVGCFEFYSQFR